MTLTQLYRKTLEKLQVVAAGEPADADDTAVISSKYTRVYNMLLGLKLANWEQAGPVPDELAEPVVSMLAFAAAGEFGLDSASFAQEGAIGLPSPSLAERQLRQQTARKYVSYPARSEYF